MAWVLLGIETHNKLEQSAAPDAVTEEYLHNSEMSGRLDYFQTSDGKGRLIDYKVWGAYSIAKSVGIFETGKRPTGTVNRYGQPVFEPIFELIPEQADTHDITLQLNQYRMFKEAKGDRVDSMAVQAISRDGGTKSAREAGIFQNFYTIEVKRLPDIEVTMYFSEKRKALLSALESKIIPARCTKEESWNGRRCNRWCNVAHFCHEKR